MSTEVVDVNDPAKGLLATLKAFVDAMPSDEQYARNEVARLMPEYPQSKPLTMRESIWALSSGLEGTSAACGWWCRVYRRLQDAVEKGGSGGIAAGNLDAIAWHLEQGRDNGGISREALAAQLRSVATILNNALREIADKKDCKGI